ncbi:MAG TPA: hypothetical protein VGR71_14235, partial [Nitrospira sp.]|nr:hypothetical protein [Nitrospira sp.]
MSDLIPLDVAMQAVAAAQSPVELVELSGQAEAFRVYARRAGLGLAVQNRGAEIRLRCERRIGEMLRQMERLRGRPGKRAGQVRLSD